MTIPAGYCARKAYPPRRLSCWMWRSGRWKTAPEERAQLWRAFEGWLMEQGIGVVDSVKHQGLTLCRLSCDHDERKGLVNHRDIRTVNLTPHYEPELSLIFTDIQDLPDNTATAGLCPGAEQEVAQGPD